MHDALIGMAGLPRSGTTLLCRAVGAHSRVDAVLEPYQVRRHQDYATSEIDAFLSDFAIAPAAGRTLLVKETTTRAANVRHLMDLMASARNAGLYTGLILILRCPIEAYLSQVEASNRYWSEKKLTTVSAESLRTFARVALAGLRLLVWHARCQHYRIVSYEAFCRAPADELARLMALVPLRLEADQLDLPSGGAVQRGGDPKTYEKGPSIVLTQRTEAVQALRAEHEAEASMQFFVRLRSIVQHEACILPDRVVLDHLTELVLTADLR